MILNIVTDRKTETIYHVSKIPIVISGITIRYEYRASVLIEIKMIVVFLFIMEILQEYVRTIIYTTLFTIRSIKSLKSQFSTPNINEIILTRKLAIYIVKKLNTNIPKILPNKNLYLEGSVTLGTEIFVVGLLYGFTLIFRL